MKRPLAGRLGGAQPRAAARLAVAALTLSFLAVLFGGCAGELPTPGQTSSTLARATTTISPGEQLGGQVAGTWSEAMQKLVPLLEGTPAVASLETPVRQLKEEYVQKLVTLGRQIAALDAEQRQAAYDHATDILESTGESDWFTRYVDLYNQYAALTDDPSQEFAVLLSTFNTLTQYAFFDVLKEQAPDEAQRLGIQ